jgi:hypothetical protein
VNSQDKKADEAICDFSINLHNPITNVKRVGVSSFTSSNNGYNVNKRNNKVRWLEQKVGAFDTQASRSTSRSNFSHFVSS